MTIDKTCIGCIILCSYANDHNQVNDKKLRHPGELPPLVHPGVWFQYHTGTPLYNVQLLKDAKTLSELDNDAVANICKAVSKDTGQSVAKIAVTKLKPTCFWIRYQYRTSRDIGGTSRPLVTINYSGAIELLRQQKQDKDNLATNNKEPEYTPLTLDTSTATKVFDKVKTLLG